MIPTNPISSEAWLYVYERRDRAFQEAVKERQRRLAERPSDWLVRALHDLAEPWTTSLADATAWLVLDGWIKAGRLYLCMRPVPKWARPNADLEGNRETLTSLGDEVILDNVNQDSDGFVGLASPIPMRRVYADRASTPAVVDDGFDDRGRYPLEVGACGIAKCTAMLGIVGRLARLPYDIEMDGMKPHVYFLRLTGPVGGDNLDPAVWE